MAANTYVYEPTHFDATTEKMESYKAWELPKRPPPVAPPMRPILPFEGDTPEHHTRVKIPQSLQCKPLSERPRALALLRHSSGVLKGHIEKNIYGEFFLYAPWCFGGWSKRVVNEGAQAGQELWTQHNCS